MAMLDQPIKRHIYVNPFIPTLSAADFLKSIPKLNKVQRAQIIHSPDLNGTVSRLGEAIIGQLLSDKDFRKQHVFKRLNPDSHARFLSLMAICRKNHISGKTSDSIQKWQIEFDRATDQEQIVIVNACAERNTLSEIPSAKLYKLLSKHYRVLNPQIGMQVALECSLFELSSYVSTFSLDFLEYFIKTHRDTLKHRLESLPEQDLSHVTPLFQCVFASLNLFNSKGLRRTDVYRIVSCLPEEECISCFRNQEPEQSLKLYLQLNPRMALSIAQQVANYAEGTLYYWLNNTSPAHPYFSFILSQFSMDFQREFFFKSEKSLKLDELRSLLINLPSNHLQNICQIDPTRSLTEESREDSSAVLSDLCETQLLILGILPDYFPFIERHALLFSETQLFTIVLSGKNPAQSLRLLELCKSDDVRWSQILKACASFMSKKDIVTHLTHHFYNRCSDLRKHLKPSIKLMREFKTVAHDESATNHSAIMSIFLQAQSAFLNLQRHMMPLKLICNVSTECALPSPVFKAPSSIMSVKDWKLVDVAKKMSYEFSLQSESWRQFALSRCEKHDEDSSSSLLSWMSEAQSCSLEEVKQIYDSIREALNAIGIDGTRLDSLGYSYEEVLASGLRGENLQQINSEEDLVKYLNLHHTLEERSISLSDLATIGYTIKQLLDFGLSPCTVESEMISSKSDLESWLKKRFLEIHLMNCSFEINLQEIQNPLKEAARLDITPTDISYIADAKSFTDIVEKKKLTLALTQRAITPTVLARLLLTVDHLYELGLRQDNLDELGIISMSALSRYLPHITKKRKSS